MDYSTRVAPNAGSASVPLSHQPAHQPQQQQQQQVNTANCIYSAQFSPHSPSMVVSCNGGSQVQVWDVRSPNPLQLKFTAHGGLEALSVDWNKYKSTVIASGGTDKSVRIWDLRSITKSTNL